MIELIVVHNVTHNFTVRDTNFNVFWFYFGCHYILACTSRNYRDLEI